MSVHIYCLSFIICRMQQRRQCRESGKNVNLNNFLKYCEIVGIDVTLKEKE